MSLVFMWSNCWSMVPRVSSRSSESPPIAAFTWLVMRDWKHIVHECRSRSLSLSPAGSVVCLIQLRPGGGSCGQLLQLPELRRVCVVQGPLLRLDGSSVSGRQDGPTWQVSPHAQGSKSSGCRFRCWCPCVTSRASCFVRNASDDTKSAYYSNA